MGEGAENCKNVLEIFAIYDIIVIEIIFSEDLLI